MATNFRYIVQHVSEQVRTFSRVAQSKLSSNKLLLTDKKMNTARTQKISPVLSDTSDYHRHFSNMLQNGEVKRPYTVVVEGNIGSGKSTFLRPFKETCSDATNPLSDLVEVCDEPVDKWRNLQGTNLLKLMYEDPKRWSLMFQTYVQLTLMQQHTKSTKHPIRIMERSLLSARYCFVENLYNGGNMTDAEYTVLSEWFNFLITCPQLDFKIDQIVYLRTDPEVAYERIKKRQRPEEHLIPFCYLKDLHELHEDWLVRKTKFQPLAAPVIVVDANPDLESLSEQYKSLEHQIVEQANFKFAQTL